MMSTITAKELRVKFTEIGKRIQKGDSFIVIYNSKPLCEMRPLNQKKDRKKINMKIFKDLAFKDPKRSSVDLIREERKS
jgi:antitoxin (DNA-binding transcriptional repressor) of toxin-antitoxin stability system